MSVGEIVNECNAACETLNMLNSRIFINFFFYDDNKMLSCDEWSSKEVFLYTTLCVVSFTRDVKFTSKYNCTRLKVSYFC